MHAMMPHRLRCLENIFVVASDLALVVKVRYKGTILRPGRRTWYVR